MKVIVYLVENMLNSIDSIYYSMIGFVEITIGKSTYFVKTATSESSFLSGLNVIEIG